MAGGHTNDMAGGHNLHDVDHLVVDADRLLDEREDGEEEALAQQCCGRSRAEHKALHHQDRL